MIQLTKSFGNRFSYPFHVRRSHLIRAYWVESNGGFTLVDATLGEYYRVNEDLEHLAKVAGMAIFTQFRSPDLGGNREVAVNPEHILRVDKWESGPSSNVLCTDGVNMELVDEVEEVLYEVSLVRRYD